MKDELKDYLNAYLGDLDYWCGLERDLDSVNFYTNGTPEFVNTEDLKAYTARLVVLMREQN